MKKIVLGILFFVVGHVVFAQNRYEIKVYDLIYLIEEGVKDTSTNSKIEIKVYYNEGPPTVVYERFIRNEGDNELLREFDAFSTPKIPVRIECYVKVNFRTGTDADAAISHNITDPCIEEQLFLEFYSPRMSPVGFRYYIKPLVTVKKPIYRIIGYNDPVTLEATPDDLTRSAYYWQYDRDTTSAESWVDLPEAPNNATVTITPSDFLSTAYIGKDLNFRAVPCDINTFGPSEPASYRLSKSAPNIKSITSTPPSCFDSTDGTITIEFDRPFDSNDILDVAVGDKSIPQGGVNENGLPLLESVTSVKGTNNIKLDANNRVTLTEVPASSTEYRIDVIASYNSGIPYYTGGKGHSASIKVQHRPAVAFRTLPKNRITNVFCHGGDDGSVTFTAEGGAGGYQYLIKEDTAPWGNDWKPFTSGNRATIGNLSKGTYQIKIKDRFDCVAKIKKTDPDGNPVLGEDIIEQITITEPSTPLRIDFDTARSKDPRAFGFTDGIIVAKVTGGTPNSGAYNFEWKNQAGTLLTNVATRVLPAPDTGYEITLDGVPKGKYYLTVWDRNYSGATYKTTCIVRDAFYELDQPDPLMLTFEESHSISCNNTNQYGDEFSDGELIVHAKGGIQLQPLDNLGLPYYYTWKKQNPNTGVWDNLSVTDSIAPNLDTGIYAVNIQDANGIILGEYTDNILVRERDSTYFLDQPKLLTVTFRKEDVVCNLGNNGWVEVLIDGGTPPYDISWSTGEITSRINELFVGKYTVFVTDSKGCRTTETVRVEQPNGLVGEIAEQKNPTCYLGNDGAVSIRTKGGTPPYTFAWDSGQNTESISGLEAGTYTLQITDTENCISYTEVVIENPAPVAVNLGENRTLCKGQALPIDISIADTGATYLWQSDNGFTSTKPQVILSESGTYTATITTSLGCVGTASMTIKASDAEIDTDFLLFSQAFTGREVTMVNVSLPDGDTVEWTLPEDPSIQIVSKDAERLVVIFENTGSYDFSLRTYQGDCYKDYQKTIFVEKATELPDIGGARNPFIEEFLVFPNPSDGQFTVKVSLAEAASISLRMFNLTDNRVELEERKDGLDQYTIDVNMFAATGAYILILETPKGDEIRKIIMK